jgi:hypothetical protein
VVRYYEEKKWDSLPEEMVASLSHWGCSSDQAIPGIFRHPAFNFILTPRSLRDWVEQNLPIKIDRQWMVALQRLDAGSAPFHTDTIREWSYNCVVHGDGALTHFKDDMDGPVVDTVCYEKNKWYFHNGSAPHAVTGASGKRVAVTVFKFSPDVAGNFLQTPRLIDAYRRDPDFYYV